MNRSYRKLAIIALFLILAAISFYKFRDKAVPGFAAFPDFNLLLITIDTLRADHLPAYGYTGVQTPNIDLLARDSLVFQDVVAHTPMTLPSHASILTGLLPIAHGVRDNAGFLLSPETKTLAEILKSKGYNTAAFVSAFVLDSQFGLNQGFDLYSDGFTLAQPRVNNTDTQRRAEETQTEVDAWLQKNKNSKFFLWVHYYDPHDPYEPPAPYKTSYDGEIAYTDHVIGRLINALDSVKENTVIVLAGDHGEGLGEHKEQTHSLFIYSATQHVPLIIRLPKQKGQVVQGVVGLIDIAPTLLEWLGLNPEPQMQGESLIPLLKEKTERVAYSESLFAEIHYGWSPLRSITTEEYKFIDAPSPELYNRRNDSAETRNLIAEQPDTANTLRRQLLQIVQAYSRTEVAGSKKVDPETEDKLRALGYVGTSAASTPESRKIDPKDKIDLLEKLSKARKAMDSKDYHSALLNINEILKEDSKMVDAHFIASTAYLHLGEKEKALGEMMETVHLKPDHIQTLYNLAFFYQIQNQLAEAEYWYLQLLKYEPDHLIGNTNLIEVYLHTKQTGKAKERLAKIVRVYTEAAQTTHSPEVRSKLLEKLAKLEAMQKKLL